ncbi:hypothetical protein [Homoserinimonas hongtaonis]|uniref:hypothetical protein n=1 Tax=Homoserinimonas hongtaonis TaxID=2079791 RepID=UPI00131F1A2E|nr:hypothetical protein [Salinibacterium hongtaonis]
MASPTAAPPVVEPIAGAAITAPDEQLLANVRHVARNLCTGVAASKQMGMQYGSGFGGVPLSLTVGADGTVSGGTATYSQLPIDMALEYFGTPEGDYSLTVRDIVSGLGVGCDSFSDNLVTR